MKTARPVRPSLSSLRPSPVALPLLQSRWLALPAALLPLAVLANPTGGAIVAGAASIAGGVGTTVVHQTSQNAVINWQQFNVGNGELVQFVQPSASAAVLNRVIGGNPSEILGNLAANGRVFLINPQGIMFGAGSRVDVGSLVASTLNIRDDAFMAGHYVLAGDGSGAIVNDGALTAREGGFVVLAGGNVRNGGLIQARLGDVVLASGAGMTLDLNDTGLVSYHIDAATLADAAGVTNTGTLMADGGRVVMSAQLAQSLAATAVNNTGVIRAATIAEHDGSIVLEAAGGDTANSGDLLATAEAGKGGSIRLLSDHNVEVDAGTVDASGAHGGGVIRLGGGWQGGEGLTVAQGVSIGTHAAIKADALVEGAGGNIAVFSSKSTTANGVISAQGAGHGAGGAVETSSHGRLAVANVPTIRGGDLDGKGGKWLVDPQNAQIIAGGNVSTDPNNPDTVLIGVDAIKAALAQGDFNLDTSVQGGNAAGDITLTVALDYAGTPTGRLLQFTADHDINLNADIFNGSNGGALTIGLTAGNGSNGGDIHFNHAIHTNGGNLTASATNIHVDNLDNLGPPGTIDAGTGTVTLGASGQIADTDGTARFTITGGDIFIRADGAVDLSHSSLTSLGNQHQVLVTSTGGNVTVKDITTGDSANSGSTVRLRGNNVTVTGNVLADDPAADARNGEIDIDASASGNALIGFSGGVITLATSSKLVGTRLNIGDNSGIDTSPNSTEAPITTGNVQALGNLQFDRDVFITSAGEINLDRLNNPNFGTATNAHLNSLSLAAGGLLKINQNATTGFTLEADNILLNAGADQLNQQTQTLTQSLSNNKMSVHSSAGNISINSSGSVTLANVTADNPNGSNAIEIHATGGSLTVGDVTSNGTLSASNPQTANGVIKLISRNDLHAGVITANANAIGSGTVVVRNQASAGVLVQSDIGNVQTSNITSKAIADTTATTGNAHAEADASIFVYVADGSAGHRTINTGAISATAKALEAAGRTGTLSSATLHIGNDQTPNGLTNPSSSQGGDVHIQGTLDSHASINGKAVAGNDALFLEVFGGNIVVDNDINLDGNATIFTRATNGSSSNPAIAAGDITFKGNLNADPASNPGLYNNSIESGANVHMAGFTTGTGKVTALGNIDASTGNGLHFKATNGDLGVFAQDAQFNPLSINDKGGGTVFEATGNLEFAGTFTDSSLTLAGGTGLKAFTDFSAQGDVLITTTLGDLTLGNVTATSGSLTVNGFVNGPSFNGVANGNVSFGNLQAAQDLTVQSNGREISLNGVNLTSQNGNILVSTTGNNGNPNGGLSLTNDNINAKNDVTLTGGSVQLTNVNIQNVSQPVNGNIKITGADNSPTTLSNVFINAGKAVTISTPGFVEIEQSNIGGKTVEIGSTQNDILINGISGQPPQNFAISGNDSVNLHAAHNLVLQNVFVDTDFLDPNNPTSVVPTAQTTATLTAGQILTLDGSQVFAHDITLQSAGASLNVANNSVLNGINVNLINTSLGTPGGLGSSSLPTSGGQILVSGSDLTGSNIKIQTTGTVILDTATGFDTDSSAAANLIQIFGNTVVLQNLVATAGSNFDINGTQLITLSNSQITANALHLGSSNGTVSVASSNTLVANALAVEGQNIFFQTNNLTVGTGSAPGGSDFGLLAALGNSPLKPSVSTPNAIFNAADTLTLQQLGGTAHYVVVRGTTVGLSNVSGASDLFLHYVPGIDSGPLDFNAGAINFTDHVATLAVGSSSFAGDIGISLLTSAPTSQNRLLDNALLSSLGSPQTDSTGTSGNSGNFFRTKALTNTNSNGSTTNFVFLSSGQTTGANSLQSNTSGSVVVVGQNQAVPQQIAVLLVDQYAPPQSQKREDKQDANTSGDITVENNGAAVQKNSTPQARQQCDAI